MGPFSRAIAPRLGGPGQPHAKGGRVRQGLIPAASVGSAYLTPRRPSGLAESAADHSFRPGGADGLHWRLCRLALPPWSPGPSRVLTRLWSGWQESNPSSCAWKAPALPLSYNRKRSHDTMRAGARNCLIFRCFAPAHLAFAVARCVVVWGPGRESLPISVCLRRLSVSRQEAGHNI